MVSSLLMVLLILYLVQCEDYVYDDIDTTKGQQVNAGINNLFTEVVWWYPTQGSDFNNRYVVFNYGQTNTPTPMGNWYTGTNVNSIRTSWIDSLVYPKPYATSYNSSNDGDFSCSDWSVRIRSSVFFEQETGTDQVNPDGSVTTLTSFIQSFNFSLQANQSEIFLAMRRFLPNFKVLTGNNQVTIGVSDYPSDSVIGTRLSPFTIDATTDKVDTRARGRYASIKIENINLGETWRFGTFQVDLQPDGRKIMTKVVVRLPEPKKEYSEDNQRQINRALTTIIEQLNSTYLTQLKEQSERFTWFKSGN